MLNLMIHVRISQEPVTWIRHPPSIQPANTVGISDPPLSNRAEWMSRRRSERAVSTRLPSNMRVPPSDGGRSTEMRIREGHDILELSIRIFLMVKDVV